MKSLNSLWFFCSFFLFVSNFPTMLTGTVEPCSQISASYRCRQFWLSWWNTHMLSVKVTCLCAQVNMDNWHLFLPKTQNINSHITSTLLYGHWSFANYVWLIFLPVQCAKEVVSDSPEASEFCHWAAKFCS